MTAASVPWIHNDTGWTSHKTSCKQLQASWVRLLPACSQPPISDCILGTRHMNMCSPSLPTSP